MPGGKGTLIGGEGYMFNPKASPEKIKAGLKWLQWKYLNPDRMEADLKRLRGRGPADRPAVPAAERRADIWTGDLRDQQQTLKEPTPPSRSRTTRPSWTALA